jgi:5-methylcytosine-specific restriction endonuclease McrA
MTEPTFDSDGYPTDETLDTIETKTCIKCGESGPATPEFFHRRRVEKDGLHTVCKPCRLLYEKSIRDTNPEYRKHIIDRGRRWRAAHPGSRQGEGKAYRAAHREEYRTWCRNRKALAREAIGTHTTEDIAAQYNRQRGRCFWRAINPRCSVSLKDGYHVDHVVPLSKGGSNGPENIVLACPTCNLQKHAKHPMDWAGVLC